MEFLFNGKTAPVTLLLLSIGAAHVSATQVIANWDVVPFQCISQPFKAGVVAFHETGVDVEFQINGISAGRITDPVWNDQPACLNTGSKLIRHAMQTAR